MRVFGRRFQGRLPDGTGCRAAVLLVVSAMFAAACSPPNPGPDAGDSGRRGDGSDAVDEDTGVSDDGDEAGGDLTLKMGESIDGGDSYAPYPGEDAEIRLIHGFQGGYHVEPSLYVTGIDTTEFSTTIEYRVVRTSDGEQLNRRETYEIDHYGWLDRRDGYLHHSNPVIFKTNDPDEVLGDDIRMEVTVDLENGGNVSGTQKGTLVDGGRP